MAAARRAPAGLPLCIVVICLYWLSLYLYVPVLSPRADRLGAGTAGVGLVLAAYGLVQLLLRLPTGLWSDRVGRRQPFFVAAILACGVGALGMGLARTPAALGAFRGVSGLGACGWVAITLLFADHFPRGRVGWALGLLSFIATASQLGGTFLGGLLAQATGGDAWPFLAAAAVAVPGLAGALLLRETAPPGPRGRVATLRERLAAGREPRVVAASALAVGMQYVHFATVYGFVPLLATLRFQAGGAALGVLSLSAGVPSALASLAGGRLGTAANRRTIAIAGFCIAAAGTALLPLAPTLAGLNVAAGLVGLGLGLTAPTLMAAAVERSPDASRGAAMGFYQATYAIGMFAGPAVGGAIGRQFGMLGLFETTALLGASAAAAAWRLLPRR